MRSKYILLFIEKRAIKQKNSGKTFMPGLLSADPLVPSLHTPEIVNPSGLL